MKFVWSTMLVLVSLATLQMTAHASCTATGAATSTATPAGPPTHTCELSVNCCTTTCCNPSKCCIGDTDTCKSTKETQYSATGGADFELYVVKVKLGADWSTKEISTKEKTIKCDNCSKATGWIGYQPVTVNWTQPFSCTTGAWTATGTITTNTPTSGTTPGNCP